MRRLPLDGPRVVVVGLGVYLTLGVATALLAARLLNADDYTVFAAYSGVLGLLVLGPSGSLEQESVLRAAQRESAALRRSMLCRAAGVWAVLSLVLLVPVGSWQERLLGDHTRFAVAVLVVVSPLVLVLAVRRGLALARRRFRLVAAANALTGLCMLLLPLVLHAFGLDLLPAFLAGALLCWLPALVLLLVVERQEERDAPATAPDPPGATAWLIAANLLVLANLLAVPPLLRWHVDALGAGQVADVQLLVSVSRLSTTAVFGFLPVLLAHVARTGPGAVPVRLVLGSTAVGLAAVIGCAVVGNPLLALLTARDAGVRLHVNLLATLPSALLCPAVTLLAVTLARRRYAWACAGWGGGLLALLSTSALDPGREPALVLTGILLASAVPLLVQLAAVATPRHRGR